MATRVSDPTHASKQQQQQQEQEQPHTMQSAGSIALLLIDVRR